MLLVEDHPDTARTLARLLRAHGHEVVWADCMAAALLAVQSRSFDILVSDLDLPDGNGHELMRRLVAEGTPLRGIALSRYGSSDDIRKSLDAGFVEHLTKPVTFQALRDALRRVAGEIAAHPSPP